ncbi:hypothetical protein [Arenibacter sp. S6351L]|uniref:hypothetical protein n=1 Tax=Flavobacteriaceae TaxID=49546 RepID=UPI001FF42FD7|nr:hypothetical protein [Arenibacter sp. S6351L]MCK0137179.1 hypothetical protein [Arenibacter sp. S6351L]
MTKKTHHIDPSKIHLKHIEELYADIGELIGNQTPVSSFDTKIAHKSAFNVSENLFLLGLKVVFKAIEIQDQPECSFRVNFHFQVDNLDKMFTYNEEDTPVFQENFVATLAGISYSTFRGMIYEKTNKTLWNGLLLPVIKPSILLQSWIENE